MVADKGVVSTTHGVPLDATLRFAYDLNHSAPRMNELSQGSHLDFMIAGVNGGWNTTNNWRGHP